MQGFDDECLGCVASHLRKASFAGGETVYQRGEHGDEMFLIVDGSVVLHAAPRPGGPGPSGREGWTQTSQPPAQQLPEGSSKGGGTMVATVESAAGERIAGKGDVFGEGGLFPELGLWRRESAMALSWVSAYVMNAAALLEIAREYPEVCCWWGCCHRDGLGRLEGRRTSENVLFLFKGIVKYSLKFFLGVVVAQ